jgi:hypothetical protein
VELNAYIQDGYDLLTGNTGVLWDRAYLTIVDGTGTYAFPAAAIEIERATYDDRRLLPKTNAELIGMDSRYETTKGEIEYYCLDGDGLRVIRIYRVPSLAAAPPKDVRVEYRKRGTALTADGTPFEIPDWQVKAVRFYAMHMALSREGDGQDLELADHYWMRFLDHTARAKRRMALVSRARTMVMGEMNRLPAGLPRPQLPWKYGKVVR